jgi:hypothetical protein
MRIESVLSITYQSHRVIRVMTGRSVHFSVSMMAMEVLSARTT